jgi:hypothetical protein
LEPRHQIGELQKVCQPQYGPPLAKHDFRIGDHYIRPLPRHGTDVIVVDAQQEPRSVPAAPLAYASEPPSAQWMERVRHANKMRSRGGRDCIPT